MKREYLEDYAQREEAEYRRLVSRKIKEGKFDFKKDKYPPNERFPNIQKPVAFTTSGTAHISNLWAQIPFSGSTVLMIMPVPQDIFEKFYFKISEIPNIIDFIKETGKLQVVLKPDIRLYQGCEFLDPIFTELNPPVLFGIPMSIFGNHKGIQNALVTFDVLGKVRFFDHIHTKYHLADSSFIHSIIKFARDTYICLKINHYTPLVEDIENSMIDEPERAFRLLGICNKFIVTPLSDMRANLRNYTLTESRSVLDLPLVYQPKKTNFPCEIGKFLFSKLTYAPIGLDACKELMYHYNAYDLQKVQESMSEAIVTNHPDIINQNAIELSEILDNIWNDKTIARKVKSLQVGVPLSMAAVGSVAAGPIGAAGGFLAGLGYSVADKFIDFETEGLSEKFAKLRTKSYQANIYDFKEKYKHTIAKNSKIRKKENEA